MMSNVTICFVHDPPYWSVNSDGSYSGILYDYTELFCRTMAMNCHYKREPTDSYGELINGSWNGVIKQIIDGNCDLTFPNFVFTEQRFRVMDFSAPLTEFYYTVVTKAATESDTLSLFSSLVFQWNAWLVIIICCVVVGLQIVVANRADISRNNFLSLWFRNCMDSFALIANQSNYSPTSKNSVKILLTFWSFTVLILCGIYSSVLVSSLVYNDATIPFNNFETLVECITNKQCQFIRDNSGVVFDDIYDENLSFYHPLRTALKNSEVSKVNSPDQIWNEILSTKNVYKFTILSYSRYLRATNNNKKCQFIDMKLTRSIYGFGIRKNSTGLKHVVSKFVSHVSSAGIYEKIRKEYVGKEKECAPRIFTEETMITLRHFFGCIFILLVGVAISCTIFLAEFIHYFFSIK